MLEVRWKVSRGSIDTALARRLTHAHTVGIVNAMSGLAPGDTRPYTSAPKNGGMIGSGNVIPDRCSRTPKRRPTDEPPGLVKLG
jgi:hypothetical protein